MDQREEVREDLVEEGGALTGTPVSRRKFLKIASAAGAAVGWVPGSALWPLDAVRRRPRPPLPLRPRRPPRVQTTTTAAAPVTTTATAGEPAAGREIRIGFVAPLTGGLASFGVADKYCVDRWNEVVADGLDCGDTKNHPIKFILLDSQSDTTRAAQVAGDLILNEKIDMMMVASTPETVTPVADQCEAMASPATATMPVAGLLLRPRRERGWPGLKWTYHRFWGLEDLPGVYLAMWNQSGNNKVYGAMWPNDADGNAFSDPTSGFPVVARPGLQDDRSRRVSKRVRGLHHADLHLQDRRGRYRRRRTLRPGLHQLLEAVQPAGLRSQSRHHRQGPTSPQTVEALGDIAYGLTIVITGRHLPVQVVPHRRDLPAVRGRVREA